jgi:hypothetical protein
MGETVLILGAGATKSEGGPLTNEILFKAQSIVPDDDRGYLPLLRQRRSRHHRRHLQLPANAPMTVTWLRLLSHNQST